ncbi:MmgE/PrpD family protein [Chloroflexota bacterium]
MAEITEALAAFAATIKFSDLPQSLLEDTRRIVLDSIGCAIGGLTTDRGQIALELARRLGGPGESTLMGTSDRVAVTNAAYANAELINAQDFDAICASHCCPVVVAAALAMAESTRASGKDLLLSIALGLEIATRILSAEVPHYHPVADGPERGKIVWGPVFGYAGSIFGATVASGKLLNLDHERMANAIGAAGYLCPPNTMRKWAETAPIRMTKYGILGWGGQGGVTAALMAEKGFLSDTDVFDGEYGFWRYTGQTEWRAENVLADLGAKWQQNVIFKHYPLNYGCAGAVDNFIKAMEENGLKPADIKKVKVTVWPITHFKWWRENRLRTTEDYCFSVNYAIACAAYRIDPTRWLEAEVRGDPRVLDFMPRVEVTTDERAFGLAMLGDQAAGAQLFETEVMAKGRAFNVRTPQPKDESRNVDAVLTNKFRKITSRVLSPDKTEIIVRSVFELAELKNVADLMDMLTP